jgi:hypothetical protein
MLVFFAGLLNRRRSGVIMLLPPPRFCSTMFCGIAKGFDLPCTCIVSDLTVSGELDKITSDGVGVFSDSSSAGKPLQRGIVLLLFSFSFVKK